MNDNNRSAKFTWDSGDFDVDMSGCGLDDPYDLIWSAMAGRSHMNGDHEKRCTPGLELRAAPEDSNSPGTLVGYPILFDSPSEVMIDKRTGKKFREIVKSVACDRCMKTADIRAMADHDPAKILGRNTAGTMRLVKDEKGIRSEIDLPDTTVGRDTAVSVARRDITGMSFGFLVAPNGDAWDRTGEIHVRHLTDIDIDDVSVVAYPAYPDTEVAMRSLERAEAADKPEEPTVEPEAAPEPEPEPEIIPEPTPDPEAVQRELERDRDRLRMLRIG